MPLVRPADPEDAARAGERAAQVATNTRVGQRLRDCSQKRKKDRLFVQTRGGGFPRKRKLLVAADQVEVEIVPQFPKPVVARVTEAGGHQNLPCLVRLLRQAEAGGHSSELLDIIAGTLAGRAKVAQRLVHSAQPGQEDAKRAAALVRIRIELQGFLVSVEGRAWIGRRTGYQGLS
jgi:hypothetical protein